MTCVPADATIDAMRGIRWTAPWLVWLPLLAAVALWLGCTTLSDDVALWGHRGPARGPFHDGVYLSLTPYRAIELTVVRDSIWIEDRRSGYYNLRQRPAVLGAFVGNVRDGGTASTFVVLLPVWSIVLFAAAPPIVVLWRRRRRAQRGFPVEFPSPAAT